MAYKETLGNLHLHLRMYVFWSVILSINLKSVNLRVILSSILSVILSVMLSAILSAILSVVLFILILFNIS